MGVGKVMTAYKIEVGFIAREFDTVKIVAVCQGQAEKLALEVVEELNPHGEEFEINHVEEIK